MIEREYVIIGGGIAGLSTAIALAKEGKRSIALIDRELSSSYHASGKNAGIVRTLTGDLDLTALTKEGRNMLVQAGLMKHTGGHLLADKRELLSPYLKEARKVGISATIGKGSGIMGLKSEEHLKIEDDGTLDIPAVLKYCSESLERSGIDLFFNSPVSAITPTDKGMIVTIPSNEIRAKTLINAAGAWASRISQMAGGMALPLATHQRHLSWSAAPYPSKGPWAWWMDRSLYLRALDGGVLFSPCDNAAAEPPSSHTYPVDGPVIEELANTIKNVAPVFKDTPLGKTWSALRTFTPDKKFVVGWDKVNPRLFWVAGLGGHGMTAGFAIGELAKNLLLNPQKHPLNPDRIKL
ncbi:MAG: NAD(P)/FAD-dependent oxidoreductase [Holophagaceae bacterium]